MYLIQVEGAPSSTESTFYEQLPVFNKHILHPKHRDNPSYLLQHQSLFLRLANGNQLPAHPYCLNAEKYFLNTPIQKLTRLPLIAFEHPRISAREAVSKPSNISIMPIPNIVAIVTKADTLHRHGEPTSIIVASNPQGYSIHIGSPPILGLVADASEAKNHMLLFADPSILNPDMSLETLLKDTHGVFLIRKAWFPKERTKQALLAKIIK